VTNDEVCTYLILNDLTDAILSPFIEVTVNYVFGATLYLIHGPTNYTAVNVTTGQFNTTYLFPTRTTQNAINYVWITAINDNLGEGA
jgi:hypothetical protein